MEAEANSSDCGFDLDMGDIPEPSYPLSNPRRTSLEGDMQVNHGLVRPYEIQILDTVQNPNYFTLQWGFQLTSNGYIPHVNNLLSS